MNAITPSPTLGHTPSSSLDATVALFLLLALPTAEATLLRLAFGLDGPPCSLPAAARRLGLRPAAARRLERRALRTLRRAALALGEKHPTD